MRHYINKYRIKSARLVSWDYSSNGYYFVTICTQDRKCYFGDLENGKMAFSKIGQIADICWREIPKHFPFVILDEYVIMPNHVHGILYINNNVETQHIASLRMPNVFGPQSNNLASIVRGFKIGVKKWATINNVDFEWQPRFYDHVIRNEESLNRIRQYIVNNPQNWGIDQNKQHDPRTITERRNILRLSGNKILHL